MFTRANELANKHSDLSRRAGTARGNLSMRNEEHILWQCTFLMNMISCCSNRACMVLILKCSAKSLYEKGTSVIRQRAHSQTKKISCTRSILWICDCAVPLHTTLPYSRIERTLAKNVDMMARWFEAIKGRPFLPVWKVRINSPRARFALRTVWSTWSPKVSPWSSIIPRSRITWTRSSATSPILYVPITRLRLRVSVSTLHLAGIQFESPPFWPAN